MSVELVTISEAQSRKGLARSTIVRWLKAGRLKKRMQGKISLRDLEQCVREQRTGRPCMSGRWTPQATTRDCRTLAEKNMEPYRGTQGLRRLGAMINALTWEFAEQDKDLSKLRDVLADAFAKTKDVEDRHADLVNVLGRRKRTILSLRANRERSL